MDIPSISCSAPGSVLQATQMVRSQVPQAGPRRSELKVLRSKLLQWLRTSPLHISIFSCDIKIFDGKVERPQLLFLLSICWEFYEDNNEN